MKLFQLQLYDMTEELRTLQEKYVRQEWCIDQYTIHKILCQEAFVKV